VGLQAGFRERVNQIVWRGPRHRTSEVFGYSPNLRRAAFEPCERALGGRPPTSEQPEDGQKGQRAEERDDQRAHKTGAAVDEDPGYEATDEGPEKAHDQVAQQSKSVATADLARRPPGDEADQDPSDDPAWRQIHVVTPGMKMMGPLLAEWTHLKNVSPASPT